jgi:hypothetical protein
MDSIMIFIYRQDLLDFYSLFPDETKNTHLPSAGQPLMYDMILSSTEGGLLLHQFLQEIDENIVHPDNQVYPV